MTISWSRSRVRRVSNQRTWALESLEDRVVLSGGVTGLSAVPAQVTAMPAADGSAAHPSASLHHPFRGVVASFDGNLRSLAAGHYAAKISWGDGTHSTFGRFTVTPASDVHNLAVLGRHDYRRAGNHAVHVTITHFGKPVLTMNRVVSVGMTPPIAAAPAVAPTAPPPAAVAPAATTPPAAVAPTATASTAGVAGSNSTPQSDIYLVGPVLPPSFPINVTPSQDRPLGSLRVNAEFTSVLNKSSGGVVAEFNGSLQDFGAGLYSATIDWGDGTPTTAGTISLNTTTGYDRNLEVSGIHTYTTLGPRSDFPIVVTILRGTDVVLTGTGHDGVASYGPTA